MTPAWQWHALTPVDVTGKPTKGVPRVRPVDVVAFEEITRANGLEIIRFWLPSGTMFIALRSDDFRNAMLSL